MGNIIQEHIDLGQFICLGGWGWGGGGGGGGGGGDAVPSGLLEGSTISEVCKAFLFMTDMLEAPQGTPELLPWAVFS